MNSLVAIELLLNSIIKTTTSDSVETNIDTNNDSNNVSNSYNGDPHTRFYVTRKDVIVRRSLKVKKKQIEYQQLINKLKSREIPPLFFSTSLRGYGYDDDSLLHMNIAHIVYILKAFLNKKQYCLTGTNFIGNCDDAGRKRYRDKLQGYMKDLTKANVEVIYSKQLNCYVIYEKKVKSKHAIRDR
jgi:hypothetical protein